eukprot:9474165-Pyramimonas_sp.AAC.1
MKDSAQLRERYLRYVQPDEFLDEDPVATLKRELKAKLTVIPVSPKARSYPYQQIGHDVPAQLALAISLPSHIPCLYQPELCQPSRALGSNFDARIDNEKRTLTSYTTIFHFHVKYSMVCKGAYTQTSVVEQTPLTWCQPIFHGGFPLY